MNVYVKRGNSVIMRLAVFDLDYTIWRPEMYQLWGPPQLVSAETGLGSNPSPALVRETRTHSPNMVLVDRDQSPMRVFDGA